MKHKFDMAGAIKGLADAGNLRGPYMALSLPRNDGGEVQFSGGAGWPNGIDDARRFLGRLRGAYAMANLGCALANAEQGRQDRSEPLRLSVTQSSELGDEGETFVSTHANVEETSARHEVEPDNVDTDDIEGLYATAMAIAGLTDATFEVTRADTRRFARSGDVYEFLISIARDSATFVDEVAEASTTVHWQPLTESTTEGA